MAVKHFSETLLEKNNNNIKTDLEKLVWNSFTK